jgi:hypothetical protein
MTLGFRDGPCPHFAWKRNDEKGGADSFVRNHYSSPHKATGRAEPFGKRDQSSARLRSLLEEDMPPVRSDGDVETPIGYHGFPTFGVIAEQICPGAIVRKGDSHLLRGVGEVQHDNEPLEAALLIVSLATVDRQLP